MRFLRSIVTTLMVAISIPAAAELVTLDAVEPGAFPLVQEDFAAAIITDDDDPEALRVAADMLADDTRLVTGVRPRILSSGQKPECPVVLLGTLDRHRLIADLIKRGKLDVSGIQGKWESFIVRTVTDPFPGVSSALVIAGSDRRGAAFGAVTVSQAIGVSPWVWWADVIPQRRKNLVISGSETQGPPSVKYRGIFINDEGNGIEPWAGKTFEPEAGNIGPKTYAKVCELLLRLKANYLWPAMHPDTRPFNSFEENKLVADRYGIVMGSSHCEPMLRNNVTEWDRSMDYNPVTNLPGIVDYWEQRVRENGKFENVFTVGMRGLHDGEMPGGGTVEEKRDRLEKIIGLQRGMIEDHVNPDAGKVPQIFCAYKEVLEIYQAGLKLPGDITLVWPEDNFGHIRQLPGAEERQRPGGSGVYYHLSYVGRPHDYLWLDSTSPALVWHEMTKAYELGARSLWVANVGDIKPTETGMTFFLDLAWNVGRYGPNAQQAFLRDFYVRQFGSVQADRMATLKDEYYRLCAIRKPEHMGFNHKKTKRDVQNSGWPEEFARDYLDRWLTLAENTSALAGELPAHQRDAYFQLVEYPACAAAAHAEKLLLAERARLTGSEEDAKRANDAYRRVQELTKRYNALGDGKWRHMMDERQGGWLRVFKMPSTKKSDRGPLPATVPEVAIVIDPTQFTHTRDHGGAGWRAIDGLGPRGSAIAVRPAMDRPTLRSPEEIRDHAPVADYPIHLEQGGELEVVIEALPTHPFTPAHEILAAISIGDGEPTIVHFEKGKDDEHDKTWQHNVLRGYMTGTTDLKAPSGPTTFKLWAADPAVVVQQVTLTHKTGR